MLSILSLIAWSLLSTRLVLTVLRVPCGLAAPAPDFVQLLIDLLDLMAHEVLLGHFPLCPA